MIGRLILFLALNFGALAIGGLFTGGGVNSDWYANLNKAPWTPPGWVFGAAWTSIMICLSIYMTIAWNKVENRNLFLSLYAIQLLLNIGWNPIFFYFHNALLGLVVISALTVLVTYLMLGYSGTMKWSSLLLLPYAIWLMIATSLNGYILLKN